jgi:hypothetical protein
LQAFVELDFLPQQLDFEDCPPQFEADFLDEFTSLSDSALEFLQALFVDFFLPNIATSLSQG